MTGNRRMPPSVSYRQVTRFASSNLPSRDQSTSWIPLTSHKFRPSILRQSFVGEVGLRMSRKFETPPLAKNSFTLFSQMSPEYVSSYFGLRAVGLTSAYARSPGAEEMTALRACREPKLSRPFQQLSSAVLADCSVMGNGTAEFASSRGTIRAAKCAGRYF